MMGNVSLVRGVNHLSIHNDARRYTPMNRFSQFFINLLTASQEPRLWQEFDAQGNMHWLVYDPVQNQHQRFDSEDTVRAWFEQRLHQPTASAASRLYWETALDGVR